MSTEVTKPTFAQPQALANAELALVAGDLSQLNPDQRLSHYINTCNSLGLNYHTQPFEYINFQGKLKLYARKECAEQLRAVRGISVVGEPTTNIVGDVLTVTVRMRDRDGREDADMGALSIKGMNDVDKAVAFMKCMTKAKRRTTFSLVGLGWLDNEDSGDRPQIDITQSSEPQLPPKPLFEQVKEAILGCKTKEEMVEFKMEYLKVKGQLSAVEQAEISRLGQEWKPAEVLMLPAAAVEVKTEPVSTEPVKTVETPLRTLGPVADAPSEVKPEDPTITETRLSNAINDSHTMEAYSVARDELKSILAAPHRLPEDAVNRLKKTAATKKAELEKKLAS